ncbi:MAG: peptidoglycan-binding protein [Hyphomicrobiaceae bacterium]|nr:peptidoglycan-binding protein [Hyphomicrobiaceae bacterium]
MLLHTCDTEAASSGSPLLIQGADGPEVVGINVGTYVRSRVITHDGRIVQRLETKAVANTAVLASTLIPQRDAFASIGKITLTRRDDITRLQQYLADAGMTPGPVDGLFGEKTRAAVVAYQSKIGHTATGLPTLPLLQRLEMTAGSTAAK